MGLKDWLKPAWKDKDRLKRLEAVQALTTQKHLISVALSDDDDEIRSVALSKIELSTLWEPKLLKQIAFSNRPFEVRMKAVERLEEDEVLCDLAIKDMNAVVRWAALRRIEGEAYLSRVAQSADTPEDIRIAALELIEDEAVLKSVYTDAASEWLKEAAVKNIHNDSFLQTVAGSDPNRWVRVAAVANISDGNILKSLLSDEADPFVKKMAIEKLDDANFLKKFKDDPSELVSDAARQTLAELQDAG